MMAPGDGATGTTALHDLYQTAASRGISVDLTALFERLGVAQDSQSGISFNPKAELAELTHRISARD